MVLMTKDMASGEGQYLEETEHGYLGRLLEYNSGKIYDETDVRYLLDQVISLPSTGEDEIPLIYKATLSRNTDLLDAYIGAGMDVNEKMRSGENILAWALRNKCGLAVSYHLLTLGVNPNDGALEAAFEMENTQALEMLLDNGANPFQDRHKDTIFARMLKKYNKDEISSDGNPVLKMLVSDSTNHMTSLDALRLYLHTGGEDDAEDVFLDALDNIYSLTRYEQMKLIELGTDHFPYHFTHMYHSVNPSFTLSRYVFACAARKGIQLLERLCTLEYLPTYLSLAFVEAIHNNDHKTIRFILDKRYYGTEEPALLGKGHPPFFAIVSGPEITEETCSLVLDAISVAQRNTLSKLGRTLLHIAKINKADHLIPLLIEKGVRSNTRDDKGNTYKDL